MKYSIADSYDAQIRELVDVPEGPLARVVASPLASEHHVGFDLGSMHRIFSLIINNIDSLIRNSGRQQYVSGVDGSVARELLKAFGDPRQTQLLAATDQGFWFIESLVMELPVDFRVVGHIPRDQIASVTVFGEEGAPITAATTQKTKVDIRFTDGSSAVFSVDKPDRLAPYLAPAGSAS